MIQRVAVYGTLKRGGSNSKLLKGTIFLGEDWLTGVTLYDLGPYPGALAEPSKGVKVEVFEVNDQTLEQLDRLEDFFPEVDVGNGQSAGSRQRGGVIFLLDAACVHSTDNRHIVGAVYHHVDIVGRAIYRRDCYGFCQ